MELLLPKNTSCCEVPAPLWGNPAVLCGTGAPLASHEPPRAHSPPDFAQGGVAGAVAIAVCRWHSGLSHPLPWVQMGGTFTHQRGDAFEEQSLPGAALKPRSSEELHRTVTAPSAAADDEAASPTASAHCRAWM